MARYKADMKTIDFSGVAFSIDDVVFDAIRENNESFKIWKDKIKECVVIECENKPRNMPLFGIVWEERT